MAISQMAKVIIVTHHTEAAELLEVLQRDGICQILNAEEAMVSRDWPELGIGAERPRDIEELLVRLTKSIAFLKDYTQGPKGLAGVLSPRTVIDEKVYKKVVSDEELLGIAGECNKCETTIEHLRTETENVMGIIEKLEPWEALESPVEELGQLETTTCLVGLIPTQQFKQVEEGIAELGAALDQIGTAENKNACLIVCLNENVSEVQKLLRSAEFEPINFEGMTGTAAKLITEYRDKLNGIRSQLQRQYEEAGKLSKNLLNLEILYDHNNNLLSREQTRAICPATESTVIFEGWVKKKDYARLEKVVSSFGASSLSKIEAAEGEEVPVEIENKNVIKPFEVVTRLYGMPQHFNIDPTAFLAPFFALFFALCLTDAGYGIIMIAIMALFIKKMQGDKKLMWMLVICSAVTVAAGAMTGGWFGDAVQQLNIGWLNTARDKMMWFDPLEKPMMFFNISLVLGYVQILAGLVIALGHNLKKKDYAAAIFDQLTWLVMLNSIVIAIANIGGLGSFFGKLALVPAVMIFLFSQREGNWGGRLGMGAYNLFSTIFYMGDVLSYLRLMALGMVTAGLAMAVNVIAKITLDIPYIGFVVMIVVLVGGHGFNLAISGLSAFVHTLRLQYVEFFPKFLIGGGRLFEPLSKQYKHIYINKV